VSSPAAAVTTVTQAAASAVLVEGELAIISTNASANAMATVPIFQKCALIVFKALSFLFMLQFFNRVGFLSNHTIVPEALQT
jgi:hypothetical protein